MACAFAAAANLSLVVRALNPPLVRALLIRVCNSVTKVAFSTGVQTDEEPVPGAVVAAWVGCPPATVGVMGVDVDGRVAVAVTRFTGICRMSPAFRALGFSILLRVMISSSILLNLAAMPANVSPGKI